MFYNISAFERTNFRDRTTCRSKFKDDLRDIFMILLLWTLLAEKLPDVTPICGKVNMVVRDHLHF